MLAHLIAAAVVVAQTAGEGNAIPVAVGAVLTPTALAIMFATGIVVRGKMHEDALANERANTKAERERAERSEDRERETTRLALPALDNASRAVDRMTNALDHALGQK